jgi:putative thiamine transport system permease protein
MPLLVSASALQRPAAVLLGAAVGLPLLWGLSGAVAAAFDGQAWADLVAHPQTARALGLSLGTGLLAFVLALSGAAALLAWSFGAPRWNRLRAWLPAMLALPHAAFAIGLLLLVAPAGWLVRLGVALLLPVNGLLGLSLDAPPPWQTTQDPWGLGLLAVLVFKEIPFLLWVAAAQLQRPDLAHRLNLELRLAQSLGYSPRSAWWRVAWPQLLARLKAPLLAVLVYNLTVVDVALLIGPSAPPTLAVLAWQWLQDADPARNALGAAAAWLLTALAAGLALLGLLVQRSASGWRVMRWTRGVPLALSQPAADVIRGTNAKAQPRAWGRSAAQGALLRTLPTAYTAVALALALGSVVGVWPFPGLWPQAWTSKAWQAVAVSASVIWTTLGLALASSAAALAWTVAWLECAPPAWQRRLQGLWYLPLLLPAVLWTIGLHRVALAWGLVGVSQGLWLAHTLCVLPYVLLSLQGPYADFDTRLRAVAASLGRSRWAFVWQIKWPLLRAALAASFAVGFAVSVAQYLPTLYVGAGRFATATTEAVALASGGQRSLMAAFAALQWLLPMLVFGLAARAGRARQFEVRATASCGTSQTLQ